MPWGSIFLYFQNKYQDIFYCRVLNDDYRKFRTYGNSFKKKAYSHHKKQPNLVNILTYCYCLLLQERKKSCYNSNILIMHNLRSMYR